MRNVPPLCFFSESDGTPLDFSEKICYHILYRRSDLGVGLATLSSDIRDWPPLCSAAVLFFIREIAP